MTPLEIRTLDFVRERIASTACAPTLEEIAAALGFASKSSARRLVDGLVRQGLLIRDPHRARNLSLPAAPLLTVVATADLEAELRRRAKACADAILSRALERLDTDGLMI